MSDHAARSALSRMNLREQFIAPHYEGFAGDMMAMAAMNPVEAQQRFMDQQRHELCEAYGFTRREQSKSFAFANGFAIIPVHGTLINRFGATYGFVTGYNFIRTQHNAALIDPDVKYIIHDHNSYGGEAAGCFELADEIFASRSVKPTFALVDSNCYSASYALASAASKIYVIPSAGVGSVGVVAMHVDMSKMLENFGVKVTFIHSGDHKVDGNPYEALKPEVKAEIQKGVDKSRAKFVNLVARNLSLDSKIIHNTEARTYRADDALELGLVHVIAVPSAALQLIIDGDDAATDAEDSAVKLSTQPQEESNMGTPENNTPAAGQPAAAVQPVAAAAPAASAPAASAPAVTDAAAIQKAERERVSGILGCEEAAGKSKMANHLAMNTDMSLADAKAMLAVSGPDAAAAPAPAAAVTSPFEQAMNNTAQPNVGNDTAAGAAAASGEKPDAAAQIMRDYEQASGFKLVDNT